VIDELGKSMSRRHDTVYRALDFLMDNGSSTASKAATPISPARMIMTRRRWWAFLICERCVRSAKSPPSGGAKPQRAARARLCAETVGGRNHRHCAHCQNKTRRQAAEDSCLQIRRCISRASAEPGAVALMLSCASAGVSIRSRSSWRCRIFRRWQAMIRSAGALPVLLLIARLPGVKIFAADGTLGAGLLPAVVRP